VFISPELLLGDKSWIDIFRSEACHDRLVGLAVDEVHYIKKWYVYNIISLFINQIILILDTH